jgi:outer membrane protein assembly factor BamE (lipoprotein component of BamABCDE complex)
MSTSVRGVAIATIALVFAAGCASYGSIDGVDNLWREVEVDHFQKGITTQADVLGELGPPSQLINLQNQTVFYYLAQQSTGQGKLFIIWNHVTETKKYDRAIFFFDKAGVLEEFAFSRESIER